MIEPYMEETKDIHEYRNLVDMGVMAWNAYLLPPEERKDFIASTLERLPPPAAKDLRHVLRQLMVRKMALFPDDRRYIVAVDVKEVPDGYYLSAACSEAQE